MLLASHQIAWLAVEHLAQPIQHRAANARDRAPLRHAVDRRVLHAERPRQFQGRHVAFVQHLAEPPLNRHTENVAATEHGHNITLAVCSRNGYIAGMERSA